MERLSVSDHVQQFAGLAAKVGQLSFASGVVLPETSHAEDEVSFIHSGVLQARSGGREYLIRAGDVTFIPAGEVHSAEVLENVTLSYVLLTRPEAPGQAARGLTVEPG